MRSERIHQPLRSDEVIPRKVGLAVYPAQQEMLLIVQLVRALSPATD
jgi:hypothetical protein